MKPITKNPSKDNNNTKTQNISLFMKYDKNFEERYRNEIMEIKKNMNAIFRPISNETAIKIEIIAGVIANTLDGIYGLDIPEERLDSLTKEVDEIFQKHSQVINNNKKQEALKSLTHINHKIFIPLLPKLTFGSHEYQLRPLIPNLNINLDNNSAEQPYILIKSYKIKGERDNNNNNEGEGEYKDCSGCEPQLVEYCKNCGRVLVNGKHPSKTITDDHFGNAPSTVNLKRELIHLLYTDIYPFVFFTTFIASMFGARGLWSSAEEKMSFFIGSITNKFIQFRDTIRDELQSLLGYSNDSNDK